MKTYEFLCFFWVSPSFYITIVDRKGLCETLLQINFFFMQRFLSIVLSETGGKQALNIEKNFLLNVKLPNKVDIKINRPLNLKEFIN